MILSLSSTLAIAIILPYVPGDISLNAIVATLSIVSKSSLIFSVSAALGQLKWDWYEKEPRGLQDLETFDEASRGPLGATKLLFERPTAVGTAERVSFVDLDEVWTQRLTRPSFFPIPETPDSKYMTTLHSALWNTIGLAAFDMANFEYIYKIWNENPNGLDRMPPFTINFPTSIIGPIDLDSDNLPDLDTAPMKL
ncbi:hypothetical protein B0T25DRAFT_580111 [Lasiosphaeria hispida]|uniref:Uncharacterized protein n=1 Tax=Lasiosphaeria hispida TaxID=260671 RepID=A0AAJ0MGV2_9PEZI|nr:hypothetical protein B0T25DRAFT_580111 [Lasiosphaeria hispida]